MGQKEVCRLCYYETTDTVCIFDSNKQDADYPAKINKYLYLQVIDGDEFPQKICWMCSQHLETFHNFYEKINEIQKRFLKEKYADVVIDVNFENLKVTKSPPIGPEGPLIDSHETPAKAEDSHEENDLITLKSYENEEKNDVDIVHEALHGSVNDIHEIEELQDELNNDFAVLEKCEYEIVIKDDLVPSEENPVLEQDANAPPRTRLQKKRLANNLDSSPCDEIDSNIGHKVLRKGKRLEESAKEEKEENCLKVKRRKKSVKKKVPKRDVNEQESGDSEDDFPLRDSDNDDWPQLSTISKVEKIIENGLLLVKGKKLVSMISRFYTLECDLCDKESKQRFKILHDLFDHYKTSHNVNGYIKCCQTKLNRYPSVIMHMARHLQPEAFTCDICGYMVTRPRFLASHKKTHLPEAERPFACDQCPRRFCWKGALQVHQISHQPTSERKLYICHICGKSYETPGGLSTHKRFIHSERRKEETHVCHVCAKTFATRTGLYEHVTTIHQPRENHQVQCSECGKWLMNRRCLKSHMILHSDQQFNCTQCNYTTKKKVLLQRHMVSQHSDDKPFECQQCGKTFKMKRALTVHLAQHSTTATKEYACTFCDRVFASSTNFYTHRKNLHPVQLQALKDQRLKAQQERRIKAGIESASANLDVDDEVGQDDDVEYDEEIQNGMDIILKGDELSNDNTLIVVNDTQILQNAYISYEIR